VFVEAYGNLPVLDAVETMARRIEATVETGHALAAQGIEPRATWGRDGGFDVVTADAAWIRAHRDLLG
jgi:hypothetical protein